MFADPHELNNLIGLESHAPVAQKMRQRLIARMLQVGEKRAEITVAASRPSGQKRVLAAEIGL